MGIIKAAISSASTMAQDQYKEYFYCPAIPDDIIMVRAYKQTSERSDNHGSNDIVTDGSIIAVADGEYAAVVSNGKVIAEYKESGPHTFVSGDTASVFSGAKLSSFGKEFGRRFAFGGDTPGVVHRVYYFNTKEMPGENFSGNDIPFRIKDENTGLDMDVTIAVSGYYTFRVANPMIIYKQMIGNIEGVYRAEYLLKIMSAEVRATILSGFGEITGVGARPSQIAGMLPEITERAKDIINKKLYDLRGVELVSFGLTSFKITGKDKAVIKAFRLRTGVCCVKAGEGVPGYPFHIIVHRVFVALEQGGDEFAEARFIIEPAFHHAPEHQADFEIGGNQTVGCRV